MATQIIDGHEVEMTAAQVLELQETREALVDVASSLPIVVSAAQGKTALHDAGLYERVESAVANHPYALMRIWWASAREWREDHEYILGMAYEVGIPEAQIRPLFLAARAVPT